MQKFYINLIQSGQKISLSISRIAMDVSNPKRRSRRRVEMKKVEEGSKRSVTFTKRRKGLFNKACELSELSGAKIAVFVISEQGKPYSCGDVDSILDQYITGKVSDSRSEGNTASLEVELMRKECKETQLKLEEETKKQREEKTGFWWEKSVEDTMEEWLKEYEAALVQLKRNVEGRLEEKRRKKSEASTSSARVRDHRDHDHDHQVAIPPVDQLHHDGFIYDDQFRIEDFVGLDGFDFHAGLF